MNIQWNQKQTCKKKIREIVFDHISEPVKFLAARCVSKPLPVDSKCGGTLLFLIYYMKNYIEKPAWKVFPQLAKSWRVLQTKQN